MRAGSPDRVDRRLEFVRKGYRIRVNSTNPGTIRASTVGSVNRPSPLRAARSKMRRKRPSVERRATGGFRPRIAVGMPIAGHPRTDPDEPDSSIRLLPWVFDGEALIGPGMKNTRRGKPAVDQFRHSVPREAVLLAAPPQRSTPEVGNVMPER